jgi:alpha-L-fucosidase
MPSSLHRAAVPALLALAVTAAACSRTPGPAPASTAESVDSTTAKPAPRQETPAQKAARMDWWTDARFGLFIHWGLYAVPAGEWKGKRGYGEWIMEEADIPKAEYEQFATRFNPVKFDPDAWARAAKDAGMKYVILTSKHHEGFALWDTQGTDYNIARRTPYGKGVIEPLAEAVRRQGLHFGVYYSIMDWHDPAQRESKPGTLSPTLIDPAQKARYVRDMKTELKELVERADVEVLWFDGEWVDWWTQEDARDLEVFLRGLKPDIIINNRIFNSREGSMAGISPAGMPGDFHTPEQEVPAKGLGADSYWESCMTMNQKWGFVNDSEKDWKPTGVLLRHIIDSASKGGNFLLNVGPTAEGEFPQRALQRMAGIGRWMRVNGEAIYGTTATPFEQAPAWGRITRKPAEGGAAERLYLHVFDWPRDGVLRLPLTQKVSSAHLLAAPDARIEIDQLDGELRLQLPAAAPDPEVSVVRLDLAQ